MERSDQLLKCPVCSKLYTDARSLPCGHSLCGHCSTKVTTSSQQRQSCYVCSRSFSASCVKYLPPNIALQNMCDYLVQSSNDTQSQEAVCHTRTTMNSNNDVIFCQNHNATKLQWVCITCRNMICLSCLEDNAHSGHSIVSLENDDSVRKALQSVQEWLENDVSSLSEKQSTIQNALEVFDNSENYTRLQFSQLENRLTEYLRNALVSSEGDFLEELSKKKTMLEVKHNSLKRNIDVINSFIRKIKSHTPTISHLFYTISSLSVFSEQSYENNVNNTDDLLNIPELEEAMHKAVKEYMDCLENFMVGQNLSKRVKYSHEKKTSFEFVEEILTQQTNNESNVNNVTNKEVGKPEEGSKNTQKTINTSSSVDVPVPTTYTEENLIDDDFEEHRARFFSDDDDSCHITDAGISSSSLSIEYSFNNKLEDSENNHYEKNEKQLTIIADSEISMLCSCTTTDSGSTTVEVQENVQNNEPQASLAQVEIYHEIQAIMVVGSKGRKDGQFNKPKGLAVASDGSILVADSLNNRIQVFNSDLSFRYSFGKQPRGGLKFPSDVTVYKVMRKADKTQTSLIIVVDKYNNKLQVFNEHGGFLEDIGKKGRHGLKEFEKPTCVAVNSRGHVIVTDTGNNRVQRITPERKGDLNQILIGDAFEDPVGVSIDKKDNIVVAECRKNRVRILSPNGETIKLLGEGELRRPTYVAVSPRGNIFVSDSGNHRVLVFSTDGDLLRNFGSLGQEVGYFQEPAGITWLPNGKLVVSDSVNCRLQVFDCLY